MVEGDPKVIKVTRLIALTASPNVEEARTAAATACRIIREEDIQLITTGQLAEIKTLMHDQQDELKILLAEVARLKRVNAILTDEMAKSGQRGGRPKSMAEILGAQLNGAEALKIAIEEAKRKGEKF